MKKLPLLFFCVIFLFTGCQNAPAEPVDKFSGTLKTVYNGVKVRAELSSGSNNSLNLRLSSPENMNGYSYSFKNDKLVLTYKNFKIKSEKDYLNKRDFSVILYNVVKSFKKEDNLVLRGSYNSFAEYKGDCESGGYILKTEPDSGLPKEISIKELNLNIKFNNVKPIN